MPVNQANAYSAKVYLGKLTVEKETQSIPGSNSFSTGEIELINAGGKACDIQAAFVFYRNTSSSKACYDRLGIWKFDFKEKTTRLFSALRLALLVPEIQAWKSGGYRWAKITRTEYISNYDLETNTGAMILMTKKDYKSREKYLDKYSTKSLSWVKRNPIWIPRWSKNEKCSYLSSWVGIKYRWSMSVTKSEKKAISKVFKTCPKNMLKLGTINQARVVFKKKGDIYGGEPVVDPHDKTIILR